MLGQVRRVGASGVRWIARARAGEQPLGGVPPAGLGEGRQVWAVGAPGVLGQVLVSVMTAPARRAEWAAISWGGQGRSWVSHHVMDCVNIAPSTAAGRLSPGAACRRGRPLPPEALRAP